MSEDEKKLFWKYRHSLKSKKEFLVKFLLSVDWQNSKERE